MSDELKPCPHCGGKTRIQQLTAAGALIAAEIDRLMRGGGIVIAVSKQKKRPEVSSGAHGNIFLLILNPEGVRFAVRTVVPYSSAIREILANDQPVSRAHNLCAHDISSIASDVTSGAFKRTGKNEPALETHGEMRYTTIAIVVVAHATWIKGQIPAIYMIRRRGQSATGYFLLLIRFKVRAKPDFSISRLCECLGSEARDDGSYVLAAFSRIVLCKYVSPLNHFGIEHFAYYAIHAILAPFGKDGDNKIQSRIAPPFRSITLPLDLFLERQWLYWFAKHLFQCLRMLFQFISLCAIHDRLVQNPLFRNCDYPITHASHVIAEQRSAHQPEEAQPCQS